MSNINSYPGILESEPVAAQAADKESRLAGALGICSIIRLSNTVGFNEIFNGTWPIGDDTVIFDRNGLKVDTREIISQIDHLN